MPEPKGEPMEGGIWKKYPKPLADAAYWLADGGREDIAVTLTKWYTRLQEQLRNAEAEVENRRAAFQGMNDAFAREATLREALMTVMSWSPVERQHMILDARNLPGAIAQLAETFPHTDACDNANATSAGYTCICDHKARLMATTAAIVATFSPRAAI